MRRHLIICLLAFLLAISTCACISTSAVTYISDFRGTSPGIPPSGWVENAPTISYVKQPKHEYNRGEKMFIGIRLKQKVTFTKYVFFSRSQSMETVIQTNDLGPFESGISFPGINNPWRVPNTPGIYDLRLYVGDSVIASVAFSVID